MIRKTRLYKTCCIYWFFPCLLTFFLLPAEVFSQDLIYSQFYNAPLQMNPAFAGNSPAPIVAMNYRSQWPSISQAYTSYSLSYDQFSDYLNSGFGIFLQSDDQGDGIIKTISASGVYSYRLRITPKLQLKLGAEAKFTQSRLDWDKLLFPDQINPSAGSIPGEISIASFEERPDNLSRNFLDISTGVLLYSEKYYAGFSLKHINSPANGFLEDGSNAFGSSLPLRWSLHAGTQINFNEGNNGQIGAFLSPNLLIVKQTDLAQINVGSLIGYDSVYGGVWYRHGFTIPDAFIFSVGFRKDYFKINYSFDFTVSDLEFSNTGGSHEIGIILNFSQFYDEPSRHNDCFSIFR